MARLRLRVAMAAFQTSSETSEVTEADITSRPFGLEDLRPYWRMPL